MNVISLITCSKNIFSMKIRIIITLLSLFIISQEIVLGQFDFQIAFSSITCNGLCDGNATVSLISTQNCGNGPYQYQIIGPSPSLATTTSPVTSATSYTFANLCAGSYSVNVLVSGNVCTSGSFNITQPPLLYTSISTILPLCAGNDGSALITVNGGTPGSCLNNCRGYNVLWTGPGGIGGGSLNACPKEIVTCSQSSATNTYSLTNLSPGTYNVTIEDNNNCPVSASFTILQPTPITVSGLLANNSIDITITGGTPGYTYLWSNGATTQDVTNLSSGQYSVTVTDANNCTVSASYAVQNQNPVLSVNSIISPVLCFGGQDGSINVTVAGGNAPYNVSWSGPVSGNPAGNEIANPGGSYLIANMPAGTYTLTITDSNGNSTNISATITQPNLLTLSASSLGILCHGGTESVTLTPSGGTPSYTYSGSSTSGLVSGTYSYTVTDANSCTANTTITITQPSALAVTAVVSTAIPCSGGQGVVTVSAVGGTLAYSGTGNFTVSAGTHTFPVTDGNGCTDSDMIMVTQPNPLVATASVVSTIDCNGGQATVSVIASGGTPSYTGIGNFNVSAGTYPYTITDANACTATTSATITEPLPILLTGSVNGNNIDISVSGGTVPYNYSWSSGDVTQDLANVSSGTYSVTVTDAFNCSISDTFTVDNVGLEQQHSIELQVFPNPAQEMVTILNSSAGIGNTYRISDCYGRNVAEGKLQTAETTFSIQALANGVYHLQLGANTVSFVVSH